MNRPTHDYVVRKACGCVVAIRYDEADKDTANWMAGYVKQGYTVDRLPLADAVAAIRVECPHEYVPRMNALDRLDAAVELDAHAHPDLHKLANWNAGKARPG